MVLNRCPGQDRRFWKPSDIYESPCPHCGESIEFFRDDITVRCTACRKPVANPRLDPGCAAWCSYAEQCLGQLAVAYRQQPGAVRDRLEVEVRRALTHDPARATEAVRASRRVQELLDESEADALSAIAACLLWPTGDAAGEIIARAQLPARLEKSVVQVLSELRAGHPESPAARLVARVLNLTP